MLLKTSISTDRLPVLASLTLVACSLALALFAVAGG